MATVEIRALNCQQVRGNRVAAEGVNRQHIVALGRFLSHLDPRISERYLDVGSGVREISEILPGDTFHRWVDLVEPNEVARPTECRDRAGSQSNHAYF